jgi:outer membrane murein-binding lipoprotein Lpp
MKASILGLAIAAVAFGASTLYLSAQLNEERAQADKLGELTRELNARIAELEKTREHRFAANGNFGGGAMAPGGMLMGPPPPSAERGEGKPDVVESVAFNGPAPPQSEAFQKMMRSGVRANNKRIYADLGPQLGLSKEETAKFIDLLTDQQVDSFGRRHDMSPDADPVERQRLAYEARREDQAEIDNFLGTSKAAAFREYQETIPARMELEQLTRQLEGADATLSDDQQKRMLAALIEERKRIPMPQMSENADADEYTKAYAQWQSDYNERVNAQARSILNNDQMTAYSDYQQWQNEMQQQMHIRRAARGPRGAAGATVTYSAGATQVAGDAMFVVVPPPPAEKPRKPQ